MSVIDEQAGKPSAGMHALILAYLSCFGEGNDIPNR